VAVLNEVSRKLRSWERRSKMKVTRMPRLILILAAFSLMADSVCASAADEKFEGLSVVAYSDKQDYVLGEMVKLTVRIANRSDQRVELPEVPNIQNGSIRLFVADHGAFREYESPGVRNDGDDAGLQVAPGGAVETEATIMYLNRRETKHLSEQYAHNIREKYLDTDYAFMKAGTYRFKVVVFAGEAELESRPVTIRIHKPKGADLQVWRVLQANPDLGYFVQLGTPKAYLSTVEGAALAKTLSDLTVAYPDSRQIGDIRLSLNKYREVLKALNRSQQEQ
jgi:hypothetical protein